MNNVVEQMLSQHRSETLGEKKNSIKEVVQEIILCGLSRAGFFQTAAFYGGTALRIFHGLDRFSEDLDFDCKELTPEEFVQMTDALVVHLRNNGLTVEVRDKENSRLTAYRRNVYFPGLLFELNLTGHREERFLMKIEAQDQGVDYSSETAIISRNGFLFPVSVPSKGTLLSMKLSALLARAKGRDFYDTIFLWQQTEPDYDFLSKRCGIGTPQGLKEALGKKMEETHLSEKQKDFQHLLFSGTAGNKVLLFKDFFEDKLKV